MKKLRAALTALTKALGIQNVLLARAQRRTKANHVRAVRAEKRRDAARVKADQLRKEGHVARAERKDKKALRLDAVATKNHQRAIFWRGRTKVLARRVEGIEQDVGKVEREIANLGAHFVAPNKIEGGTPKERWFLACLTSVANCAKGKRRNFYSMPGSWDIDHVIEPGESPGERSDCSSTVTGWAKAAGLDDPNGADWSGGFTGTLLGAHGRWRECSLEAMLKKGWGYIVYGSGNAHHTEAYTPSSTDKMRTSGHGSAPVDFGTVHLFGSGEVERYFIYDAD